ncbi:unnamed protein product [Moneuplotes crassus]|uniref:Uncharacterized protein n=1 Tax=Euplotes crassus TaxID=5936 RepID=A0AAD1UGC2_EUPCR|nr:unnamed protein product [Moneuplotes crassus]
MDSLHRTLLQEAKMTELITNLHAPSFEDTRHKDPYLIQTWLKMFRLEQDKELRYSSPKNISKILFANKVYICLKYKKFEMQGVLRDIDYGQEIYCKPLERLLIFSNVKDQFFMSLESFFPSFIKIASYVTRSIYLEKIKLDKKQISCLLSCLSNLKSLRFSGSQIATEGIKIFCNCYPYIENLCISQSFNEDFKPFGHIDVERILKVVLFSSLLSSIDKIEFKNCDIDLQEAQKINKRLGKIFSVGSLSKGLGQIICFTKNIIKKEYKCVIY